jgi:hypothetical protein
MAVIGVAAKGADFDTTHAPERTQTKLLPLNAMVVILHLSRTGPLFDFRCLRIDARAWRFDAPGPTPEALGTCPTYPHPP